MKYPIPLSVQIMLKETSLDIVEWCSARNAYVEVKDNILWVSDEEYYEFLRIHEKKLSSIIIGNLCNIEATRRFNALVYYTLCGKNGIDGIKRYINFKNRIGPIRIRARQTEDSIYLQFIHKESEEVLSNRLLQYEKAMLQNVLAQGGGNNVPWVLHKHKGGHITVDNEVVFTLSDLRFPFLKENNHMAQQLSKNTQPYLDSLIEEVQSFTELIIMELVDGLSRGEFHVIQIAKRLDMSERNLQRHLHNKMVTFKQVLQDVQQMMIKVYLALELSSEEIAFLVGFETLREFLVAFKAWFGIGLSTYKEVHNIY